MLEGLVEFTYKKIDDPDVENVYLEARTINAKKMLGWHFPPDFLSRVHQKAQRARALQKICSGSMDV